MVLGKLERNKMMQSNVITIDDPWYSPNVLAEPSPKVKFTDDPLALSCASYRVGLDTGSRWQDLEYMKPTDEDRKEAQLLKSYYMERLVLERLTKQHISPFREKMGAFLAGNLEITKKDIGMLYKLPYFFAEDQIVDQIMEETDSIPEININPLNNVKKLKPLRRLFQSRRAAERTTFWFTTEQNQPVAFTVAHNNALFGLVESLFTFSSVTLAGNYRIKNHVGYKHNYYNIYSAQIMELEPNHG